MNLFLKTIFSNFEKIIKLINIKNIENKNVFLDAIKKNIIILKNEIALLDNEQLNEAVKS